MADIAVSRNIGGHVSTVTPVPPQSSGAATIDGSSIDRFTHSMALSCVLHTVLGAVSGSPSAVSVQSTLQHSPDNSTWANYPNAQAPALTAASTENSLNVDLTPAQRYIRVVTVVGFTGGSSPAALLAADLIVAGEDRLAAV